MKRPLNLNNFNTKSNIKPWLYRPNWQGQCARPLLEEGHYANVLEIKNGRCKFHNIIGPVDLPPWNIQTYFPLRATFTLQFTTFWSI